LKENGEIYAATRAKTGLLEAASRAPGAGAAEKIGGLCRLAHDTVGRGLGSRGAASRTDLLFCSVFRLGLHSCRDEGTPAGFVGSLTVTGHSTGD